MISQKLFNNESKYATFSPAGLPNLLVVLGQGAFFGYFKEVPFYGFPYKTVFVSKGLFRIFHSPFVILFFNISLLEKKPKHKKPNQFFLMTGRRQNFLCQELVYCPLTLKYLSSSSWVLTFHIPQPIHADSSICRAIKQNVGSGTDLAKS